MNLLRSEEGSSLLEFSLILPLVLLLFLGVVDLGFAVAEAMSVEDAARAGAEYGSLTFASGNSSANIANIEAAAQNAAGSLVTLNWSTAPSYWWSCNGSPVASTSACGSAGYPVEYVQVQTSATVNTILGVTTVLNYVGLPTSLTLQGFSALRVQ